MKAVLTNTGKDGVIYRDWKPFTSKELMKHIGVYFLQGVSPSPQVEMKFNCQATNPCNGNDMVYISLLVPI